MELKQIILVIVTLVLSSCLSDNKEVTITGNISGNIPDKIEYTLPINGISYFGFEESIQPDSLGNFQINITADKSSFIELSSGYKLYGTVIVEPGSHYDIFINTDIKENGFRVEGQNEKGQKLYNQLTNRSIIDEEDFEVEGMKYFNDTIASEIKQNIQNKTKIEISGFKELLNSKAISKSFYDLVKTDREYFYKGAQSSLAFIKLSVNSKKDIVWDEDGFRGMWKEIYQGHPATDTKLLSSPWFYNYVENYLRYIEQADGSFDDELLDSLYKQGSPRTYKIENAKINLTGPVLEYYYAAYLYYVSMNKNYEKELISLFEEFKEDYPLSLYTRFLEPEITSIMEFHKLKEHKLNDKIIFIDDYENIDSFKEVVETLKGKKIFVDVWATWCSPCKVEFGHKKALMKLLESKNVEILYISTDRDEKDKQWKDMIKFYDLEGYHIRANKLLNADLQRLFGKNSMSIPWYMLVDENGNILIKNAEPPSQMEKLEKQLDDI